MRTIFPKALFLGWFGAMFILAQAAHGFYDPSLGRWINRDPIGEAGGMNLYAFAENNPAGAIDGFGLKPAPPVPPPAEPQWDDCNEQKKKWIKRQLKRVCDKLQKDRCQNCLNDLEANSPGYVGGFAEKAQGYCDNPDKLTIHCSKSRSGNCSTTQKGTTPCAVTQGSATITLCPNMWVPNSGCPSLYCALAHEMGHVVAGWGDIANKFEKCFGCPGGPPH